MIKKYKSQIQWSFIIAFIFSLLPLALYPLGPEAPTAAGIIWQFFMLPFGGALFYLLGLLLGAAGIVVGQIVEIILAILFTTINLGLVFSMIIIAFTKMMHRK